MIELKEAVGIAKAKAVEALGQLDFTLEEFERETYRSLDVWAITLGFPKRTQYASPLGSMLGVGPKEYKTFLIDTTTGELMAMRLREVAT